MITEEHPTMTRLPRLVAVVVALALPSVALAAVPTKIGQLNMSAAALQLKVSANGQRALALMPSISKGQPAGIQIIDMSLRTAPVPRGFYASDADNVTVMPDGHLALLTSGHHQSKSDTSAASTVTALDLSDPDHPRPLWRRKVHGDLVLAPDAGAYAVSELMQLDNGPTVWDTTHAWRITVHWLAGERPDAIIQVPEYSTRSSAQFSAHARFLAYPSFEAFGLIDLRNRELVSYSREPSHSGQEYRCVAAVMDAGYVIADNGRAPRLGIYAPQANLPRIGLLDEDRSEPCRRLDVGNDDEAVILAGDQVVAQLDVSAPARPAQKVTWFLPENTHPLVVVGHLLYSTGGDQQRQLQIWRLDGRPPLDWVALANAHRDIMKRYAEDVKARDPQRFVRAVRALEGAGAMQALDAPVMGISSQQAAEILNAYGFLARQAKPQESVIAETALRRAVALDPARAIAVLQLADLLRERLSTAPQGAPVQSLAAEIEALLRRYLALGAETNGDIEDFLNGRPAPEAKVSLCSAVVSYANAGRLRELVSSQASDISIGGRRLDFLFTIEGSSHTPAAYAFNAATDSPVTLEESAIPGGEELWGGDLLGMVLYRGEAAILHYRDLQHPVQSVGLADHKSCRYVSRSHEEPGPRAMEPKLCQLLSSAGSPQSISVNTAAPIDEEHLHQAYGGDTSVEGMALIDVENNNQPVNVGSLHLSSGSGAGCEAEFYDALNRAGDGLASGAEHDVLMNLQGISQRSRFIVPRCGNSARFFRWNDRVYFESKPAEWPPVDAWDEYHRVARIQRGAVEEVCDFKFMSQVSLEP